MGVNDARKLSEATKKDLLPSSSSSNRMNAGSNFDSNRRMTPIRAQDISKSFRRICMQDFSDVVDRYHTAEQRESNRVGSKYSELYQHAVRLNDTKDAVELEQRLLASNLNSVGEVLNQFIASLFRVLQLEPIVQDTVRTLPDSVRYGRRTDGSRANAWQASDGNLERQVMVHLFVEKILAPLDFHPSPRDVDILGKTAYFMSLFFSRVDPARVMFFTPIEEEE